MKKDISDKNVTQYLNKISEKNMLIILTETSQILTLV